MRKGIVMEVDRRFLTLLTPEGEFLKARKQKQDYLIGQEIDFFPVNEVSKKKSLFYSLPGKAVAAAVFALMIASASFLPIYGSNDVYAYMSIDVNPSIELAVNDELEVINLKAYNIEGEQIISKLGSWKKQDVSIVTTQIIDEIKKQGYFQNHDEVIISTVYEEKTQPEVTKQLEANIEEIENEIEKENLQLTVIQGTKEERKTAKKQGITTGVLKEKQPEIKKKADEKENNKENIESKASNNVKSHTKNEKNNKSKHQIDDNQKNNNQEIKKENKDKNQAPGQQKKGEDKDREKKSKKDNGKSKKTVNNHDQHEKDDDKDQDRENNDVGRNKDNNDYQKDKKNHKKEDNKNKDHRKNGKEHHKNNDHNEDD